jgi:hypothetical protein
MDWVVNATPRPWKLTHSKRPDTHCTGDGMGHRAGQDGCGKLPEFNPRTVQHVASWYTDCAFPAPNLSHSSQVHRLRSVTIHLHILSCLFLSVLPLFVVNEELKDRVILSIIFYSPSFSLLRIPFPLLSPDSVRYEGHAVAQCLRPCATNRKVAGSIPDGVIGIFRWHNPSGRNVALELTQPLTEMNTRNIFWGYGGRCVRLAI